jgi:phosphoglycolate phosphatase-like HAD superfamily hydrolase
MRDIEVDVLRRCSAVFPGSRETLIELSRTVALHTASGNLSWRIEALLDGLGVTRLVGLRAGPDLVGAAKRTLRFYERLFELARVPPERALIVEDDPTQIELALELRAHAVHVRAAPSCGCGADGHLASLNELPEWIFDA